MNSELFFEERIFPKGFFVEYTFNSSLIKKDKKLLITRYLELFPFKFKKNEDILNFKGADSNNLILDNSKFNPEPEELLFISGTIQEEDNIEEKRDFTFSLNTKFKSFKGKSNIIHSIKSYSSEDNIDLDYILVKDNFEINYIRFGSEFFKSHFFAFVGFSPVVDRYLSFEIVNNEIRLKIKGEGLKNKKDLPLDDKIFNNLDELIDSFCSVSIKKDYLSKL